MKVLYRDIKNRLSKSGVREDCLKFVSDNRDKLKLDEFIPLFQYSEYAYLYNDRIALYMNDYIKMLCIVQLFPDESFGSCRKEFSDMKLLTGDSIIDRDILKDLWVNNLFLPNGSIRQWLMLLSTRNREVSRMFRV